MRNTLGRILRQKVHRVVLEQPGERVTRRLAAILVAGYSRLLPGDEKENFGELRRLLTTVVEPQIAEFGGNVFKVEPGGTGQFGMNAHGEYFDPDYRGDGAGPDSLDNMADIILGDYSKVAPPS